MIAAETGSAPVTVEKWASGDPDTKSVSDYAFRAACAKLGIEPPPQRPEREVTRTGSDG